MLVLFLAWCLSQIPTLGVRMALGAAVGAFGLVAALIALQPDISQTAFLALLFLGLLFLAGLGLQWVILLMTAGVSAMGLAYLCLTHVRTRIDGFISRIQGTDGDRRDHNDMAADAFRNGGLEGLGWRRAPKNLNPRGPKRYAIGHYWGGVGDAWRPIGLCFVSHHLDAGAGAHQCYGPRFSIFGGGGA